MATIVSFHAHPDDESIQTGGTLALAARAGHRVVLVFATRGEHGEVEEGFLGPDETLAERRERESERSAEVLGAGRVAFLGYVDSGMAGTPENDQQGSFWRAELDEAAARLAAILEEEQADVLTVYDDGGGYGHPDHIQVHRVGVRAATVAGTPLVLEATMNRDHLRRVVGEARRDGTVPVEEIPDVGEDSTFGRPEAAITHRIDVREVLDAKRASMAAHASQISETSFFLQMPDPAFEGVFGWEWYVEHGATPGGEMADDVFASLR
jgi:LmbE family N-acetylglucosaminyl deacetylase